MYISGQIVIPNKQLPAAIATRVRLHARCQCTMLNVITMTLTYWCSLNDDVDTRYSVNDDDYTGRRIAHANAVRTKLHIKYDYCTLTDPDTTKCVHTKTTHGDKRTRHEIRINDKRSFTLGFMHAHASTLIRSSMCAEMCSIMYKAYHNYVSTCEC